MNTSKTSKQQEQAKEIDLSEYTEEKIPFDAVIRKLAKSKPAQTIIPKHRAPKSAPKDK
jgi:hypothetical protein